MDINLSQVITSNILKSGHKCVFSIKAGLVEDWVITTRILALVENQNTYGLLVFITSTPTVKSASDLTIESTLPVNDDFKCEIDATNVFANADLYVKITSEGKKYLFELSYQTQTNTFIAEINKAIELHLRKSISVSFDWLRNYSNSHSKDFITSFDNNSKDFCKFEDNFSDMLSFGDKSCEQTSDKSIKESFDPFLATNTSNLLEFNEQHFRGHNSITDWIDSNTVTMDSVLNSKTNNVGNSSFYSEGESSDNFGNIPRHSIASGATPLAARESVIRAQMTMCEEKYTNLQTFRILIGTWNVNGQTPSTSLRDWLAADPTPPDIYAIGFQELDLSKEAFLFNETPKEEMWFKACKEGLHPKASYELVRLVRLIGMMLIVFIKKELRQFVTSVSAETVGTGILGKMGNKGGVAVRMEFHNSSLCFVNSHLAAHVEEYERRNQDYNEICSRLTFNQFKPPKYIKDHDHIYWFGDLNYRLMDLSTDQVKNMLNVKAYQSLLEHDQLRDQMQHKNVFVGYTEGEIRHLPTYKYDTGTDNWDSSEKSRPPAWCDRILWRTKEPTKQLIYRSHPKLLISDHKPVSALFDASIKVIDNTKYRKIYEEVMKKLDKLENEFLPQVTVDKMEVIFSSVSFRDSLVNTLTIANTGQVPLTFEFIKKPNEVSYCKQWLRINPYTSRIMPGNSLDIELEVSVDKTTAPSLNNGTDEFYDIIVLHLDGGKDLFITVTGDYECSCFGTSIETLIRLKCPLKQVSKQVIQKLELKQYSDDMPPVWDIPKELWILVDQLYKYGMLSEDLFQQSGLISEFRVIRNALDKGFGDKFNVSVNSLAEALIVFLEALSEPVIPYSYYNRSLECSNNFILCKQVVNELPEYHKNVFYYLIAFLRELLRHSNSNKLDSKILASIFGSVVLRSPEGDWMSDRNRVQQNYNKSTNSSSLQSQMQSMDRKKSAFVFHFLVNDFDI